MKGCWHLEVQASKTNEAYFCSQNDFLHFFTLLSHVGFPEPPPDLSRPFGGYQTKLVVKMRFDEIYVPSPMHVCLCVHMYVGMYVGIYFSRY